MTALQLKQSEKDEIIKEILGSNYAAAGNDYETLSSIIDYIGYANDAVTMAELIPTLSTLMAGSTTFSTIMSGASVVGIILFPVAQMINVINAYNTGHRGYACRCVAYTVTAWSFNQAVPAGSNQLLRNTNSGIIVRKDRIRTEYDALWKKTSMACITQLNKSIRSANIQKSHLQVIFQALGGGNKQALCLNILKGFEGKMDNIAKLSYRSNYRIKYPL